MATYYIRTDGSDTNSGTASGSGSAWKTIGKALSTGSSVVGGDTVYIAPGTYREAVTVGINPSSNVNITGDPKSTQFSGIAQGPVIWSGFGTNDDTAPTGIPCSLGSNGNFTFTDLVMHGDDQSATGDCFNATTAGANITWTRCVMLAQVSRCISATSANNQTLNWTIDSCSFFTTGSGVVFSPTATSGTGAVNLNIVVKNSIFHGGNNAVLVLNPTGTGSTFGGITVYNCTFMNGSYGIYATNSAALTTTYKVKIRNCNFYSQTTNGIIEALSNFFDEDYNRYIDVTFPRSVTTTGANSKTAGIHGFDAGAGLIQGYAKYHPLMPQVSDILTGDGTSTGAPTIDILGFTRPGTPSIGAFEQNSVAAAGGLIVHPGTSGGMRG